MPETAGYIVHLKEGVDKDAHLKWLQPKLSADCEITYDYSIIHGFAGNFCQATVDALSASGHVARIEKDIEFERCSTGPGVTNGEEQSPWGLNRISQANKLTTQDPKSDDFTYLFNDWMEVDIYFMETEYLLDHVEFEDRARYGFKQKRPIKESHKDFGKHGTAVVSAAAGKTCGPAKHANIVACVVDFYATAQLKCLEWIVKEVKKRQLPAVINLSFGQSDPKHENSFSDELAKAIADHGIHVCVAAGNSECDAKDVTPANTKGCNAIGGCSIEDKRCKSSNYGAIVKLFAPSENVYLANYNAIDTYRYGNGTSYASPYVAGMIAYFLSMHGHKTPADMSSFLQSIAVQGVLDLGDIPKESHTVNLLAYNSVLTGRGVMRKGPYDV